MKDLKDIVQIVLNKDSNHGELFNASRDLSDFFGNFSSISTKTSHFESNDSTHTILSSGVAISPLDAAICTNEYMRTAKYLRGVYEAIKDLLEKFKGEKIHIFYAGCGPYGTLIIPLLHLFDAKDVEVSFLDIHTTSLNSIKSILKALGLENFAKDYTQEDASLYRTKDTIHMIVTETMKAAFDNEPQVAITLNLLPQLHKEGIFIPQRVVVGFEEANYQQIVEDNLLCRKKDSKFLCDVLDLDTTKKINEENLICTKEHIVFDNQGENMQMQFTTTIYTYKDNILEENECSLNIPKKIDFDRKLIKGDKVYFKYRLENLPKIEYWLNSLITSFKDWIPQRINYKYNDEQIIWYNMKDKRFIKPFFDDSFSFSNPKKCSTWKDLTDIAKEVKEVKPTGFIFHTSRCGSTLLSQILAEFDENIVLSEAQLIHEALTVDYNKKISKEEKVALFKDTIKVLGQKRFEKEKRLFIKFDAWSIAELPFILELYPDVPWVFLYRNPVEVLVSQKRKRGLFTIPSMLKGKLFEEIPKETTFDEYSKVAMSKIFETALKYKDLPNGIFIDYKELKNSIQEKIFPHFHLELSKEEIEKVGQRLKFDAKQPIQNFIDDSKEKRDEADEEIKSFCDKCIFDNFQKLEDTTSKNKSFEIGKLGIFHIKYLWDRKIKESKGIKYKNHLLSQLDYFVLDGLNINIAKSTEYLLSKLPSFEEFENWILKQNNDDISPKMIDKINKAVKDFIENGQQDYPVKTITKEPVFTADEMKFWEENGYIVLKDAVDKKDCKELESAIWNYLELSPSQPQDWQNAKDRFWLSEFTHPLLEKTKNSKKIFKAFEQLWGTDKLFSSTHRVSFNPPLDNNTQNYGPSNIHWDTSLSKPIPFDIFGLLYLNDIKEEQGAFQCIPRFHKKIDVWIDSLEEKIEPREEILKDKYQKEVKKVSANAGDFIICRQELPHGSSINCSDYPRFVHYINFYPPNRRIDSIWK